MKKIITFIFLALVATTLLAGNNDLLFSINTDEKPYTAKVVYNDSIDGGYFGKIVIPSSGLFNIDGKIESVKINCIGSEAFKGCENLKSIRIPNGVTHIGSNAFEGCSSLKSINIPSSVMYIDADAVMLESDIMKIIIKARNENIVQNILSNPFTYCSSLFSIKVAKNNNIYDSRDNCNAIILTTRNKLIVGCKNTIIPNSVTEIGESAFEGCSALKSITIPNSVTEIGGEAFKGCSSLESITIPNSVTEIGEYAFEGCSSLVSIAIPNGVTEIGGSAFEGCSSLESITIPNSVTEIVYETFKGCSSLESITIPNSVTEIGDYAFEGCSSLESITIPNSITYIGSSAFEGCSLKKVVCESVNVPKLSNWVEVFGTKEEMSNITLYVPSKSLWKYRLSRDWNRFGKIRTIEGEPTIGFTLIILGLFFFLVIMILFIRQELKTSAGYGYRITNHRAKDIHGDPSRMQTLVEYIQSRFNYEKYKTIVKKHATKGINIKISKGGLFKALLGLHTTIKLRMKIDETNLVGIKVRGRSFLWLLWYISLDLFLYIMIERMQLIYIFLLIPICLIALQITGKIKQVRLKKYALAIIANEFENPSNPEPKFKTENHNSEKTKKSQTKTSIKDTVSFIDKIKDLFIALKSSYNEQLEKLKEERAQEQLRQQQAQAKQHTQSSGTAQIADMRTVDYLANEIYVAFTNEGYDVKIVPRDTLLSAIKGEKGKYIRISKGGFFAALFGVRKALLVEIFTNSAGKILAEVAYNYNAWPFLLIVAEGLTAISMCAIGNDIGYGWAIASVIIFGNILIPMHVRTILENNAACKKARTIIFRK